MVRPVLRFLLYCCLLATVACRETAPAGRQTRFFDLKAFMDGQKQALGGVRQYRKTITTSGGSEEKTFDRLALDAEFAAFAESDINRPAWSDKYRADSTLDDRGRLVKVLYTALEPNLKTREMSIAWDSTAAVQLIRIVNGSQSSIAASRQELRYLPGQGFDILNEQRFPFSQPETIRIQVDFLK